MVFTYIFYVVKERHIYFAEENVDFPEDIADGKRSLNETTMPTLQ